MSERWIVIPNWESAEFQHPDAARSRVPPWIKQWTRQLSDQAYLNLSLAERGLLSGIHAEYARSLRMLPLDAKSLSRRLGARVSMRSLERLKDAGFLEFAASRPASTPAGTPARPDGNGDSDILPTQSRPASRRRSTSSTRVPFSAVPGMVCPECDCAPPAHAVDCSYAPGSANGHSVRVHEPHPFDDSEPDPEQLEAYA